MYAARHHHAVEPVQFLGMHAVIASPAMRDLLRRVERIARTNATVLIQGESGSGKELIARALHQFSLRCARPWVDVSCGALPEHLLESELFGHEKGAFSGAEAAKPGLFELAHGGTLFLDEIGELDARMQVKLLRVLDGVPYYRLGGVRKVNADVRVLAATNQDLAAAVEQGRFRKDLYHRLAQVSLLVPPLREREEDIPAAAAFFLERHDPALQLSAAAYDVLRAHDWPGNLRELRNAITTAAINCPDGEIQPYHLPLQPQRRRSAPEAHAPGSNLGRLERETILRMLGQTGGQRQRTAELLGISRRTLSRKLRQYRLDGWVEPSATTGLEGSESHAA